MTDLVIPAFASRPLAQSSAMEWKACTKPACTFLESSREIILAGAELASPGQVLVLGAGECSEIPVRELAQRHEAIILLDVDGEALSKAAAQFEGLEAERTRIRTVVADLNGIRQDEHLRVLEGVESLVSAQNAARLVVDRLKRVSPRPLILPIKSSYVVASCVLSQLHIGFLQAIVSGFGAVFPGAKRALTEDGEWETVVFELSRKLEANFLRTIQYNIAQTGHLYFAATTHMMYYRNVASNGCESPGLIRTCHNGSVKTYLQHRYCIRQERQFCWDTSRTEKLGEIGHAYLVDATISQPVKQEVRSGR